MIASLATVDDLADRVGEVITEQQDIAMAKSFLRLVSAQVRHFGADWTDPILAPDVVVAVTIEAAARGYLNPEGWVTERGDELTLQRDDIFARGSTLTMAEIKMVQQAAVGRSGIVSVPTERVLTVARDFSLHAEVSDSSV